MNMPLQQLLLEISLDPKIDQGNLLDASLLIITTLRQQLEVDRLSIWLLDENQQQLDCLSLIDQEIIDSPSNLSLLSKHFPKYFKHLTSAKKPIIIKDQANLSKSELYLNYYQPLAIISTVEVPVRHHGKVVGVISMEHRQPRHWTEQEITYITVFADIFSRAINAAERFDYQQQLQQLNSQLELKILQRTKELTQSLATLKNTQQKMIEVEKMASLGRMVAGISHEISTPLGIAVTANSHGQATLAELEALFLSGQLTKALFAQKGQVIINSINLVTNNLQRTVDLVDSIKQTALEPSASSVTKLRLAQFIPQVLSSLADEIAACQLSITLNIPADLQLETYSSALATIIRQLIDNVCVHAFSDTTERTLQINIELIEQNWQLTLVDNGKGMSQHQLSHAFEPFFTSNRSGGSKGLGLTLVFNLVTQILQGHIQLFNKNNGLSVQITCPLKLNL
ncbi:GAF domain-containing sensor histidine kinase [Rheinheimera sp. MMS21-TC3]|uniref:GAF domain-containing sensor histidine kinase n=1 Tax=Rheinheimera sp. MMS21-TC3 TaxID=3072790 RepID=UPI0028C3AD78|nr:GAF domain-containing sensor histidine kinase [Rheinheimera sp. MMS21-TC3]WNO61969.1 GAF domain-containing sensor histidine kinase [Rheinheimera sp. MMS21-TC3]